MTAGQHVKSEGKDNDLLELIASDDTFNVSLDELEERLDPSEYTGCAAHQTERFIAECADPILEKYRNMLGEKAEVSI